MYIFPCACKYTWTKAQQKVDIVAVPCQIFLKMTLTISGCNYATENAGVQSILTINRHTLWIMIDSWQITPLPRASTLPAWRCTVGWVLTALVSSQMFKRTHTFVALEEPQCLQQQDNECCFCQGRCMSTLVIIWSARWEYILTAAKR